MNEDILYRRTRELTQLRTRAQKLERQKPAPETGLIQVVEEALASCASLLQDLAELHIERQLLLTEADTQTAAWERLFDLMPMACVVTDSHGEILNANVAAGHWLNVSAKRLRGRQLLLFIEDREALAALLRQVTSAEGQLRAVWMVRPRERKAIETAVVVAAASPKESGARLWFFTAHHRVRSADAEPLKPFADSRDFSGDKRLSPDELRRSPNA
jgi:PAS domain S-box-containing protein